MKVLVAEDERGQRRLLEATLARWDYEVVCVGDGRQAWDAVRSDSDPPRLIVLDWVMPGMDGPQVCQAIRDLGRERYIYILLLTSRDRTPDIVAGMEAGADDYLTKPWHPQELSVRLNAGRRIIDLQDRLIEARDALCESEERYRILFEGVPIGLGLTDATGRVHAANSRLCDLLGYTLEELQEAGATSTYADPNERRRMLAALDEAGEVRDLETRMRRRDGLTFEASLNVRRAGVGGRRRLLSAIQDISERKRAEAALREAARLDIAAKLAGGTAHIINNRMMAVIGYAQILEARAEGGPEAQRLLSAVADEAQRASDLAYRLLAFAQGGRWETEAVNLSEIVCDHVAGRAGSVAQGITTHLDLCPEILPVDADPMQMQQVVACLYQNAIEALGEGGQVTFTTRNLTAGEAGTDPRGGPVTAPHVMLSVQDTGCGMSEETQAHIFEPFFTTKLLGRGMGLAAVHGIVRNHGGHISVCSDVGSGATFDVFLPVGDYSPQVAGAGHRAADMVTAP